MSLSSHLEELLSGYVDNRLDQDELREVHSLLNDPLVRQRIQQLQSLRADLKLLAERPVGSELSKNFTASVLARLPSSRTEASIDGSPVVEASLLRTPANSTTVTASHGKMSTNRRMLLGLAAVAAALMLAALPWMDRVLSPWSEPQLKQDLASTDLGSEEFDATEPAEPPSIAVQRDDLIINYVMTADVELAAGASTESIIVPLLKQHGVQLMKGARVDKKVAEALDGIRMTSVEKSSLSAEVYLIRAVSTELDGLLETFREDSVTFPAYRLGMVFELPGGSLMDKLSIRELSADSVADAKEAGSEDDADSLALSQQLSALDQAPLKLGQAMAAVLANENSVDPNATFAAPLVTQNGDDFRPSPFESIPLQGKLVGASKNRFSASDQLKDSDQSMSFLLLFVRQR